MIITIAGLPGSGKTTVAKMLADKLRYTHYSMGDLRGEVAQKHGMTIDELNEVGKKEDWAHREVDVFLEDLGKTKDNLVIDTWIGFHLIPKSVKIFISADLHVAAERILDDIANRPDEKKYASVEEAEQTLINRIKATDEGFKRLYGVSFLDPAHYSLSIDTTNIPPEAVISQIMGFLEKQ